MLSNVVGNIKQQTFSKLNTLINNHFIIKYNLHCMVTLCSIRWVPWRSATSLFFSDSLYFDTLLTKYTEVKYQFKVDQHLVLNGLNHEDSATCIKWKIYIEGVKKWRKNICWRIRFSAIAHLQKAPITASSEDVPDSWCSAHGRKYYFFVK